MCFLLLKNTDILSAKLLDRYRMVDNMNGDRLSSWAVHSLWNMTYWFPSPPRSNNYIYWYTKQLHISITQPKGGVYWGGRGNNSSLMPSKFMCNIVQLSVRPTVVREYVSIALEDWCHSTLIKRANINWLVLSTLLDTYVSISRGYPSRPGHDACDCDIHVPSHIYWYRLVLIVAHPPVMENDGIIS